MAKYKASPFYDVDGIRFDHLGEYETDKVDEIKKLDALCPVWIKRVDEPKNEEKAEETAPAPKEAPAKKTSAK